MPWVVVEPNKEQRVRAGRQGARDEEGVSLATCLHQIHGLFEVHIISILQLRVGAIVKSLASAILALNNAVRSPTFVTLVHVQVTVNEREPEDMALRRFRRLCGAAKVVYEVRPPGCF